jgi:hypothetical protein
MSVFENSVLWELARCVEQVQADEALPQPAVAGDDEANRT